MSDTNINFRIIKRIKESEGDQIVKDYLIEILSLEREYDSQARWSYTNPYSKILSKLIDVYNHMEE